MSERMKRMAHPQPAQFPTNPYGANRDPWSRPAVQSQAVETYQYPVAQLPQQEYTPGQLPQGYNYSPPLPVQTPNHQPAPHVAPQAAIAPATANHNRRNLLIGAGAFGAALVAGGLFLGLKGSSNDTPRETHRIDTPTSQSSVTEHTAARPDSLTASFASVTEFRSDEYFTDTERVAWAWSQLEQPTHEAGYEGMTRLEAANAKLMKANSLADKIVEPSVTMTGDQILANEQSIYYFAATTDELSDTDRSKVLAAALDNSNVVYDTVMQNVLERDVYNISAVSEVETSAVNHLPVESPVFKYTVLDNGFDPKGIETKVMNVSLKNTNFEGSKQKYYQFIDGKPVQVYQCDSRDKTVRASNPQNIPAN